ncbi:TPA: hypothetical protein QEL76_001466 [Stenotrophomonas maltophilia]|nr:hypothetical protein [Stenotrophomonas maltophilia]
MLYQNGSTQSGIRGRNARPEIHVRKFLHAAGFRCRLHVRSLPGNPDVVLPRYRLAIFVHGCFWHRHTGCRYHGTRCQSIDAFCFLDFC